MFAYELDHAERIERFLLRKREPMIGFALDQCDGDSARPNPIVPRFDLAISGIDAQEYRRKRRHNARVSAAPTMAPVGVEHHAAPTMAVTVIPQQLAMPQKDLSQNISLREYALLADEVIPLGIIDEYVALNAAVCRAVGDSSLTRETVYEMKSELMQWMAEHAVELRCAYARS